MGAQANPAKMSTRQNEPHFVGLLAASSHYYGLGKRALAVQLCLTVGLALAFPVINCFWPEFKPIGAFIAISVTWLDVTWIDRIQIHYRKLGALVQERMDCELFGIPWNDLRCGRPPDTEDLHRVSARYLRVRGEDGLKDWHAAALDELPLPLRALASQRICLWWEKSQRKIYGYWLIGLGVGTLLLMGGWAVTCAQALRDTLLVTYASIAPGVIWCIREGRRQGDAAGTLERARAFVDSTWKKALGGVVQGQDLVAVVRQIQDTMFDNRSKNPLMFNWIYRILRPSHEEAMRKTAEELAGEVREMPVPERL